MRVALVLLAACSAHVSQDRATGPDGVIEGANPIAIDAPPLPAVPEPENEPPPVCESVPPDPRDPACAKPSCSPGVWDPQQGRCITQPAPAAPPITGHVMAVQTLNAKQRVVSVDVGTYHGVDRTWRATFLDQNGKPIASKTDVIRVDSTHTVLRTSLTQDQINANPTVRLAAP